jgi:hypothetical protein
MSAIGQMKQEGFLISDELKLLIRAVQKHYFEEVCNLIAICLSFSSCSYLHHLFLWYLEVFLIMHPIPTLVRNILLTVHSVSDC